MSYLQNVEITLQRIVNHKKRYIAIDIYSTLFPDMYIVNVEYGSVQNKSPTGIFKKDFKSIDDAKLYIKKYVTYKIKKGYKFVSTNI